MIEARKIQTPDGLMTRREISEHYKVPFGTVCARLWKNYPIEAVIDPNRPRGGQFKKPPRPRREGTKGKPRFMTPWGRKSIFDLAEIIGIAYASLGQRLYKAGGWPQEEAFNTPAFGKRGVDFIMPPAEYDRLVKENFAKEREKELAELTHNGAQPAPTARFNGGKPTTIEDSLPAM